MLIIPKDHADHNNPTNHNSSAYLTDCAEHTDNTDHNCPADPADHYDTKQKADKYPHIPWHIVV